MKYQAENSAALNPSDGTVSNHGTSTAGRWGRRQVLGATGAVVAGAAAATVIGGPAAAAGIRQRWGAAGAPTVVLVHGAFVDGSSWQGVIGKLLDWKFPVMAVQNRLASLADDVASLRRTVDAIDGPVILVGHSYGGAVISGASAGATNVKALVFVAAVTPDDGESVGAALAAFPATYGRQFLRVDSAGYASIDPAHFRDSFAADVDERRATLLAVAQKPVAVAAQAEPSGPAGWKQHPTYFAVSAQDQQLATEAQQVFAARMNARTITVQASHASYVSRPDVISGLIADAARDTCR